MRCLGCGALLLREGVKCPLCSRRLVNAHPRVMGEAAVNERQRRQTKYRTAVDLLHLWHLSMKTGQALVLSRPERERLDGLVADVERDPVGTKQRLMDGAYD